MFHRSRRDYDHHLSLGVFHIDLFQLCRDFFLIEFLSLVMSVKSLRSHTRSRTTLHGSSASVRAPSVLTLSARGGSHVVLSGWPRFVSCSSVSRLRFLSSSLADDVEAMGAVQMVRNSLECTFSWMLIRSKAWRLSSLQCLRLSSLAVVVLHPSPRCSSEFRWHLQIVTWHLCVFRSVAEVHPTH